MGVEYLQQHPPHQAKFAGSKVRSLLSRLPQRTVAMAFTQSTMGAVACFEVINNALPSLFLLPVRCVSLRANFFFASWHGPSAVQEANYRESNCENGKRKWGLICPKQSVWVCVNVANRQSFKCMQSNNYPSALHVLLTNMLLFSQHLRPPKLIQVQVIACQRVAPHGLRINLKVHACVCTLFVQ